MKDIDNYRRLAAQARTEADAASLDNVRERCLRSAAAWTDMAQRAERTESMRATLAAAKAKAAAEQET